MSSVSGTPQPQEPVSGETILLNDKGRESVAEEVIEHSRKYYAKEYREVVKATNKKSSNKNVSVNNQVTPIGS